MSKKAKRVIGIVVAVFIVVILALVVGLDVMNTRAQRHLLEESIQKQLMSITLAARDRLDVDAIAAYNSLEDVEADLEHYIQARAELRKLAGETGADYIYVLKYIGDEVMFVMDTDEEDEAIFIPYDAAAVHMEAFAGHEIAGVMNVEDEYGSYNTAAVPVWKDGHVIAVVSTDIEDYFLKESIGQGVRSQVILVGAMVLVLAAMAVMMVFLLSRVERMQRELSALAHRDTVTGLPNRQYLMEYLEEKTKGATDKPFALFFIDLDNFKSVNDTAGHDTGDELLRRVAVFLETSLESSRVFRPAPGALNIAARIGGDEFVLAVDGIADEVGAAQTARQLLDEFSAGAFKHYEEKYGLGMSIGIALYPKNTRNFHVLIKFADMAMYHAKHGGKNDYRIYEEDMEPKMEK
ncbi:MAG: diguanylate cyclase [Oscillospiraceae bacterium]